VENNILDSGPVTRATVGMAAIIPTAQGVSPLRPGTFWHTSGLRKGEFLEFLESIAH